MWWSPMLTRVKYVSRFSRALSSREVEAIVDQAQRRNATVGITGVLLAFGDVFMQILEGPPDVVRAVMERIAGDRRHRDLVVVRRQEVERPIFGGWSMRLLELGSDARRDTTSLLALIESIAHGTATPTYALHDLDDMLWRTLGERAAAARRVA